MTDRDALIRIEAMCNGDRVTVTPETAWRHWQTLNRLLVDVRTAARSALAEPDALASCRAQQIKLLQQVAILTNERDEARARGTHHHA